MGTSFFDSTEEQQGFIPACTGAKLKIKEVERKKTQEKGYRMYVFTFGVVEPVAFAGMQVRDWIVIGNENDPKGEKEQTWKEGQEKGPGRLKRLLVKAGVPLSADDEEWMEAAEGRFVVAPVIDKGEDSDGPRNKTGKYYNESDSDCPEIGFAEASANGRGRKKNTAKAASEEDAPAPKASTSRKPADDDDED